MTREEGIAERFGLVGDWAAAATRSGEGLLDPHAIVADAMVRYPKQFGPAATVADVRVQFGDDHVLAALLVDDGRLQTVVERGDLTARLPRIARAADIGTLSGRTVLPDADLRATWALMRSVGRRRLAVVTDRGYLLGLLCLKRSGLGFCSDAGVSARAAERLSTPTADEAPETQMLPLTSVARAVAL
ncbi:hypothetical protein [Nocardioides sp. KR10-350]|uniref:CBS domain-containing protein n=1 Tax=Nocardioides cheoyonin TaxID=3156615 RepID=UPI0032B5CA98